MLCFERDFLSILTLIEVHIQVDVERGDSEHFAQWYQLIKEMGVSSIQCKEEETCQANRVSMISGICIWNVFIEHILL